MSDFNFQPMNCRNCGNLIWDGLTSAGIPMKLDPMRLTILDEILKLTANGRTYQLHRTSVSFEATRRTATRMNAVDPIVLAEHLCSPMTTFGQIAPEYFNRPTIATPTSEKVPF